MGSPGGPMPLGPPMGPILILILIIILIFSTFFKLKIAEKSYTPPFFKMIPYDPEPIFKVYIPVFRPPGHYIDGLGLYYQFNLNVKKKKSTFFKVENRRKFYTPPFLK